MKTLAFRSFQMPHDTSRQEAFQMARLALGSPAVCRLNRSRSEQSVGIGSAVNGMPSEDVVLSHTSTAKGHAAIMWWAVSGAA